MDDRRAAEGQQRGRRSGCQHSTRVFYHHAFSEKEPSTEVDRNRLVRSRRKYRIRPPYDDAVELELFEAFHSVGYGFSHADRRDFAAAASSSEDLGGERQMAAASGDVFSRFGRYLNHGGSPLSLRLTIPDFYPIVKT